jgi:hypothetical protein
MHVTRRRVRYAGAALAGTMALIYAGIGLGVLDVGASDADREFLWVFGALAGSAFLLGAFLLLRFDRRWLWILGLGFQLFVFWAYIDVAKTRTPPFESWGILLRVIQVPLLAALAYLAVRPPEPVASVAARPGDAAATEARR